ncbi:21907_t:CDS:2, partial [Gigaspora rosea]
ILALQNRLNNNGIVLKLAHIRIKQGNLACQVLVKARELKVSFGFDENWWYIYGGKYPIRNLLQEEKESRNLISGLQDTIESKLLQDEVEERLKRNG